MSSRIEERGDRTDGIIEKREREREIEEYFHNNPLYAFRSSTMTVVLRRGPSSPIAYLSNHVDAGVLELRNNSLRRESK